MLPHRESNPGRRRERPESWPLDHMGEYIWKISFFNRFFDFRCAGCSSLCSNRQSGSTERHQGAAHQHHHLAYRQTRPRPQSPGRSVRALRRKRCRREVQSKPDLRQPTSGTRSPAADQTGWARVQVRDDVIDQRFSWSNMSWSNVFLAWSQTFTWVARRTRTCTCDGITKWWSTTWNRSPTRHLTSA